MTSFTDPRRDASATPRQPSLFGEEQAGAAPGFDAGFAGIERIALDEHAWLDFLPGWIRGAEALFEELRGSPAWEQRSRWMYEGRVLEPRLTFHWSKDSGEPLEPPMLEAMRWVLSERYGVEFDSVGFNLYRDGRDSVAWHGDRIAKEIAEPIVPLVSLGEPRRFLLRPKGGGRSRAFLLGRGDLLVTGGTTQRTWDHSVPKVARAGPRISIAFRYGLVKAVYGRVERTEPR